MAIFNPSNQLLQIDTGNVQTYCWNPTNSPIQPYANVGEIQVPGQRYVGVTNTTPGNPYGSPAVYMLVQYLPTSATTLANWRTPNAPAPVYWTDNTFTTVTGITTEGIGGTSLGLNFPAGYLMLNYAAAPKLTLAQLLGGYVFIQVAGYLKGAYTPTVVTGAGIGASIVGVAGTFSSSTIAAGTAATYQPFGRQLTAIASSLCDVLVGSDNF
jgi:hypothetical protein